MTNILLVEDEPAIADTLRYTLEQNGLQCLWASTISEAHSLLSQSIDLCILDIGLPDGSGLDLCKEIRQQSDLPILFLTARQDEIDRIIGLEIGGDDYVGKPFSPREVCARVKAILRRKEGSVNSHATHSEFEIQDAAKKILFKNQSLDLTRQEYMLLHFLLQKPKQVFSRTQLMNAIWEVPESSMERTVDTHIKSLRKKINTITPNQCIKTHRGFGYSFEE